MAKMGALRCHPFAFGLADSPCIIFSASREGCRWLPGSNQIFCAACHRCQLMPQWPKCFRLYPNSPIVRTPEFLTINLSPTVNLSTSFITFRLNLCFFNMAKCSLGQHREPKPELFRPLYCYHVRKDKMSYTGAGRLMLLNLMSLYNPLVIFLLYFIQMCSI